MSDLKKVVIQILVLVFFISCGKEDINNDGLIDDAERKIMMECSENLLESKSEIESNLIGKWTLIGHGTPIFQNVSQPIINLTISDINLIIEFKSENVEMIDTLFWEIEELNSSGSQSFNLNTTPKNTALIIHQFCEKYMYGETSPINDGGNMYLYERVE